MARYQEVVESGSSINLISINSLQDYNPGFTRTGFKFLGWSTNKDAIEPEYYDAQGVTFNSDVILYAIWKSDDDSDIYTITIEYDVDGGTPELSPTIGQINNEHNVEITLPSVTEVTKEGYQLSGWLLRGVQMDPGDTYIFNNVTSSASYVAKAIWTEISKDELLLENESGSLLLESEEGSLELENIN